MLRLPNTSNILHGLALALFLIPALSPTQTAPPQPQDPDLQVEHFQLDALAASLSCMPTGPNRDYFAGILANRTGHFEESIRLLNSALPAIRTSHPHRAAIALKTLADNYAETFRYADAARSLDDLIAHFPHQLRSVDLQGSKDDAGVFRILGNAPPQTIAWSGPTRLPTRRNEIDSIVTELTVNGVRQDWLLDTGANLSVVSRSFARRLGITPLPGHAQTMAGATGIENPLQVAILPLLKVGGATLRNVVLLVLNDANLRIAVPGRAYQIQAILGYPALRAMGSITFRHDGFFEAGIPVSASGSSTRMDLWYLTPVIQCGVEGQILPFSFDTGADGTMLSMRYKQRFHEEEATWKQAESNAGGAGGNIKRKIFLQPTLSLQVGSASVVLHNVPILSTPTSSYLDELYGNLGQDFVGGYESFTLDFSKMTFSLGPLLPAK